MYPSRIASAERLQQAAQVLSGFYSGLLGPTRPFAKGEWARAIIGSTETESLEAAHVQITFRTITVAQLLFARGFDGKGSTQK